MESLQKKALKWNYLQQVRQPCTWNRPKQKKKQYLSGRTSYSVSLFYLKLSATKITLLSSRREAKTRITWETLRHLNRHSKSTCSSRESEGRQSSITWENSTEFKCMRGGTWPESRSDGFSQVEPVSPQQPSQSNTKDSQSVLPLKKSSESLLLQCGSTGS